MRFGKFPKLVKKQDNICKYMSDTAVYEQLKKAALKQKQVNSTINKEGNPNPGQPPMPAPLKRTFILRQLI
jgi:hypothetical protein